MTAREKTVRSVASGFIGALLLVTAAVGAGSLRGASQSVEFFDVGREYWACSGQNVYTGHYARAGNICLLYVEFEVVEKGNNLMLVAFKPTETSAARGYDPVQAWVNPDWFVTFQEIE